MSGSQRTNVVWGRHVRHPALSSNASVSQQSRRITNGGVIYSHGRGAVATPQSLVVCSATVNKDEREIRARSASSNNPRSMYGPPSKNDVDFSVYKGLLGLANPGNHSSFRASLGNSNHASWNANMAGLPRDSNSCIPSVAQVSRSALDLDSEDKTTLVIHGVQTIVNTGRSAIACGQHLYVDPNPWTTIKDGQIVSAVEIAGIPADVLHVQVCPITSKTQHAQVRLVKDRCRVALAKMDFAEIMRKGDSRALVVALRKNVRSAIFVDETIAEDMPLRDIALLSAVNMLRNLSHIPGGISNLDKADGPLLHVVALQAEMEILRSLAASDSRMYRDMAATLPQNTREEQTYAADDSNIHGARLTQLLSSARMLVVTGLRTATDIAHDLNEARARINMHMDAQMCILLCAQSDYMRRFFLGTALSGATKGGQLDVMMH